MDERTMSSTDAAARLRYVSGIQTRARRAVLLPSFAFVALGAAVALHGVLVTLWPHAAVVSLVWLGGVLAVRPGLRWLRHRIEQRRGLQGAPRLRAACAAAALVAAGLAVLLGASPLVAGIAVATAVAAYLGGLPSVALAAIVVGVAADVLITRDAAPAAGELVFGAGLVIIGLVARAREREDP
jgi:hypothetical protein